MKRLVSLMLIFLIVLPAFAVFTPKARASENVIFQDDFESYAVGTFPSSGGWQLVYNGAGDQYQVITSDYSASGSQSLQMEGQYGWSAVVAKDFASSSNLIGFEAYLMGTPGCWPSVGFGNEAIQPWGRLYGAVGVDTIDGYIVAGSQNLQPCTANTWYKIREVMDRNAGTFDVWIDDQLKGTNIQEANNPWEIQSLRFDVGWHNVLNYYDDVKVFEVSGPPPPTGAPQISSVSPITATRLQTIHIYGSGFGNTWPQTVSLGDGSVDTWGYATPYMCVSDSGKYQRTGDSSDGGDNWAAGVIGPGCYAMVGIILLSWSDNEIVLGGFGNALGVGQGTWYIANGDPITVTVVTSSGQATYNIVVGGAPPPTYSVTLTAGSGGSISYSYSGGLGTVPSGQSQQLTVSQGGQVSLTANPDPTYCFQTWGVDNFVSIPSSDLSSPSATATINENVQITAYFGLKTVTSTSLTCSPNSVSGSSSVVCTAIVSPFNPTGSVAWTTFPIKGSFSQSTCILTRTSAGLCSTTYTPDRNSATTVIKITATYSGDSNNEASSGSCQLGSVFDPNHNSGFIPSLKLANGIAQPNLYDLVSSTGTVQQCYDDNGLSTCIKLSGINTNNGSLAPVGYSEAAYGNNLLDQSFGNTQPNQLKFPMQVSSLNNLNLWGASTYSLYTPSPSSMPYNFFYDLWLEKNPTSGQWPQSGDFEVGISLAYAGWIGTDPYPTGVLVGHLTDQIYVNGQEQLATWDIYYEILKGSAASFYDFSLAAPTPQNSGTVSIRFQDFISALSSIRDLSTYSLMGVELGTEYSWGGLNGWINRQATWAWFISSYYLTSNTNNFLTIVSSANAQSPTPKPPPTVPPTYTFTALFSGNKHITLTGSNNVVITTGGNDVIDATQATATTVIKMGAGNDIINLGGGNNNVIEIAGGNDIISAGNGDNTITITGNGNYQITTGSGNDQIQITGDGNSIINAGNGDNTVTVSGKGNNQITTGSGNDVVVAGNGNNIIRTGAGNDSITVGNGNNYVDGGAGYDVCIHGTGHNTILNCEKT